MEKKPFYLSLVGRNPKREIERKLSNFSLRKGFLAVVIGICNIPFIEHLIAEKDSNGGTILVLEADRKNWTLYFPKPPPLEPKNTLYFHGR